MERSVRCSHSEIPGARSHAGKTRRQRRNTHACPTGILHMKFCVPAQRAALFLHMMQSPIWTDAARIRPTANTADARLFLRLCRNAGGAAKPQMQNASRRRAGLSAYFFADASQQRITLRPARPSSRESRERPRRKAGMPQPPICEHVFTSVLPSRYGHKYSPMIFFTNCL